MRRVTDYEILTAVDRGLPLCVVAGELQVPLRRVCRVASHGWSAHNRSKPLPERVGFRAKGEIRTAANPSKATAAYWEALAQPLGRPIRSRVRRGPTFEQFLETAVALLGGGGGRGVA
ncbi:MAG: hypothetical protein ACOY93_08580 [Bacillota bacterium]